MKKIHFYFKTSAQFLLPITMILSLAGCIKPHAATNSSVANSNEAISDYAGLIKSNIESQFYYKKSYVGKTCSLRITLAPDGLLLAIKNEGGDPEICQAALEAAIAVDQFPAPPNQKVYDVFKSAVLDFKF